MQTRRSASTANAVLAAAILTGIVAGVGVVWWIDPWPRGDVTSGSPEEPPKIDPALIRYEPTGEIRVTLPGPRALAVGPDGVIYVGGDDVIHVHGQDGMYRAEIRIGSPVTCLAVGGKEHDFPGRIYVGMTDHVEVLDADGKSVGTWDSLGEKALLTSIAAAKEDVFAADARNRTVWRYDTDGQLKHRIGDPDAKRNVPGFVITPASPYFDLALSHDGLLRVVNPRMHRIEAYTFDGDPDVFWGEPASTVEGFFGCCNPGQIAVLSDGRFVTVEKGAPRVKIHDVEGKFECVVAGPEQLTVAADDAPPDVAVDGKDRVLILDHKARCVRVFEPKTNDSGAQ